MGNNSLGNVLHTSGEFLNISTEKGEQLIRKVSGGNILSIENVVQLRRRGIAVDVAGEARLHGVWMVLAVPS